MLSDRLGRDDKFIRLLNENARQKPQRIIFTEGDQYRILKAAEILINGGTATPVLLGPKAKIEGIIEEYQLELSGAEIIILMGDAQGRKELPKSSTTCVSAEVEPGRYEAKSAARLCGNIMLKQNKQMR